ncbi:MAG: protease inhibitor I42 family protein [Rhodospirillales bacterium]
MSSPSSCIDETANGRTLAVELNQTFEICLRENPTTGYRWSFDADGSPFAVLVDGSFQSGGDRPGAGGIHRWRFRAAEPGSTKIALSYRRPWEQGVQPEQTFALTVRIEAR